MCDLKYVLVSENLELLLQINHELPVSLLQVLSEVVLHSINGLPAYLEIEHNFNTQSHFTSSLTLINPSCHTRVCYYVCNE